MRIALFLSISCAMFLLASCGSGGSGLQAGPELDLPGTYSGTYTVNTEITPIPFTLVLTSTGTKPVGVLMLMETTYTGTFTSPETYGQVSGNGSGLSLSLMVNEPNDGGQISISGDTNGTVINIKSITGTDSFGTYTSGSGSCTKVIPVP